MTVKKTEKKRKPGRPKGSVKRTSLGEDVNHRLTKGETAMYLNVKKGLVEWIIDNGETDCITSPVVALVSSGVAMNQPFFYDRLMLDPDVSRAVDIVRSRLFLRAINVLRDYALRGSSPKWMEIYLRIISSDKDLGRLTGGVKFGEVANLTVDNRKQINIQAPPVEGNQKPAPKRKTRLNELPPIGLKEPEAAFLCDAANAVIVEDEDTNEEDTQ